MRNLPEDAREREIFLRALRLYSETCEPPELLSDCPFSIDVSPGQRSCGEECIDLLERYGGSRLVEGFDMGNGIVIRRNSNISSRRYVQLQEKAYDAREIYLADQDKGAPQNWRLPSVLQGIVEELSNRRSVDIQSRKKRRDRIEELVCIVEEHGINFEDKILPNLRPIIGAFAIASLYYDIYETNSDQKDTWKAFLKEVIAKFENSIEEQLDDYIILHFVKWADTASFDDLVDWIPPKEIKSLEIDSMKLEIDVNGKWIMDRFTQTYLDKWSTDSLCKEWLYIQGEEQAPCLLSDMRLREIPINRISAVMADRLTQGQSHSNLALVSNLVVPSLDFIKEGRRVEAAALFEASIRLDPTSADAHNNLGFCILPDDPVKSLKYFEKALELGDIHSNRHIYMANRILALSILGKRTLVIQEAQNFICPDWAKGRGTYMWRVESLIDKESQEPEIMECQDLGEYVRDVVKSFEIIE